MSCVTQRRMQHIAFEYVNTRASRELRDRSCARPNRSNPFDVRNQLDFVHDHLPPWSPLLPSKLRRHPYGRPGGTLHNPSQDPIETPALASVPDCMVLMLFFVATDGLDGRQRLRILP